MPENFNKARRQMYRLTNSIGTALVIVLSAVASTGCDRPTTPVDAVALPPESAALEKRAVAGDAEAQFALGEAYSGWESTKGVDFRRIEFDEAKAALWYEKAAEQGHVGAQRELGRLYLPNPFFDPDDYLAKSVAPTKAVAEVPPLPPGAVLDKEPKPVYVQKDAKKAIAWFTKAAISGDAESQFQLGLAYASGSGVEQSIQQSRDWYTKAAEQGHGGALNNLALAYLNGAGVPKDSDRAIALLLKAAEQGYLGSAMTLAGIYERGDGVQKDEKLAFEWYLKVAEKGWNSAQSQVAWMYYSGSGVAKDNQQAAAWWRKAADQRNGGAQRNLGILYRDGQGVPKDLNKAFDLFLKSAASGDAIAQAEVGKLLFNGEGTTKDVVLGYAWANLSAAAGNEPGLKYRIAMEQIMEPGAVSEAQRISSSWTIGTPLARSGATGGVQQIASTGSLSKVGSGTIFIVSKDGHAVTNHHVVNGCKELRLQGTQSASKLVTADAVNDLALLNVTEVSSISAPVSADPARMRQGEDIVVFGFPLNAVLSSGGNLTPGVVSALTGLGNNTNQIQITAPIQPGSSGSPVLNKKGEVVAVVSQKLSDGAMAKATGSIGQNVNFAVNGQTLRSFLDANQVKYKSGAGFFAGEKSTADLADAARQWTRVVECWK